MPPKRSPQPPKTEIRDWKHYRDKWVATLEKQTGEGLEYWNKEIGRAKARDKEALRSWLAKRGVTGYAAQVLVMERFGYPDWALASAADLIGAQYADRPQLRPIYDAIISKAEAAGSIVIQARKTYVSLLTPRRTFARIVAGNNAIAVGLRLEGWPPAGRLRASRIHETMPLEIALASIKDLDRQACAWLREAYQQNA